MVDVMDDKVKASLRRHHKFRVRAARGSFVRNAWDADEKFAEWQMRRADTRCPCSRACCGNPRRHYPDAKQKLTRQERRFLDSAKAYL